MKNQYLFIPNTHENMTALCTCMDSSSFQDAYFKHSLIAFFIILGPQKSPSTGGTDGRKSISIYTGAAAGLVAVIVIIIAVALLLRRR